MDTIYIYITRRHIFIISIKHVQSVVILNLAMYNCTTKKLFLLVKHCIVDEPKNFEDYYYENIILKKKNEEIHADSQIIIRSKLSVKRRDTFREIVHSAETVSNNTEKIISFLRKFDSLEKRKRKDRTLYRRQRGWKPG